MDNTAVSEKADMFVVGLNKSQKRVFDELQDLLTHQQSSLAWYHCVGSTLLILQGSKKKRETGATKILAEALGISSSNVTKVRKFATEFSRSEVEHLDQIGCNWGLVTVVQHAPTNDRMRLLEQALGKNWTVSELHEAVKQRFGARNPGGRPLRKPRTKKQGLRQLQVISERWLKFYQEVWAAADDSLSSRLLGLAGKDLQTMAPLLHDARNTIQSMRKAVVAMDELLSELERKVKGRRSC
jgi:hypothetical protein